MAPPSYRPRFNFTDMVTIYVGEEAKEFLVYKSVLTTSSSKFLAQVLARPWKEAKEKRILLPGTQVYNFEVYLHWMYTQNIQMEPIAACAVSEKLVELYILGDYLVDAAFCAAVVKCMLERRAQLNEFPSPAAVRLAWEGTAEGNALRPIIVEIWLSRLIGPALAHFAANDDYPCSFVLDLVKGMVESHDGLRGHTFSHKTTEETEKSCKELLVRAYAE